jgi:hypothetical protein
MNHKMQSTCGAGILRCARAVLTIAAAAGLVSAVGAAGGDTGEKEAMVLDAEAILNRWEPVAKAAGAAPYWREQYATQLRQLPDYLVEQIAALEPLPDDALASYRRFGQAFVNAYANLVLNPRAEDKARNKLGSTTNDQVFIPIAPCRVVDTRNAGALVTPDTLARAAALGLKPAEFLDRNDAYNFFKPLGDLVVSGPTFTNVNDFRALLVV